LALVATPQEAFVHPEFVKPQWTKDGMDRARFEDALSVEGEAGTSVLSYLGREDGEAALHASRVAYAVTDLTGLDRAEVSEIALSRAVLAKDVAPLVTSGHGVILVQTVLRAKSMTVSYRDERGQSIEVKLPASTVKAASAQTAAGEEQYTDVVLAYKAAFIAGGPGSDLTDATATDLTKAIKDKGFRTSSVGNLSMVEATPATAKGLSEAVAAAAQADKMRKAGDPGAAQTLRLKQAEQLRKIPDRAVVAKPRALDARVLEGKDR